MAFVLVAWLTAFAANAFALRPELAASTTMYFTLLGAYGALALASGARLARAEKLGTALRFQSGDVSIGLIAALLMLAATWLFRSQAVSPGSAQEAWVFGVLLQAGDVARSAKLTALLVAVAALEEFAWRGGVLHELERRAGKRRAFFANVALYASAQLPTAYTLRDASAGYNPMLPLAALGCGIVWAFLASRFERLLPAIISHVAFTYFATSQTLLAV